MEGVIVVDDCTAATFHELLLELDRMDVTSTVSDRRIGIARLADDIAEIRKLSERALVDRRWRRTLHEAAGGPLPPDLPLPVGQVSVKRPTCRPVRQPPGRFAFYQGAF